MKCHLVSHAALISMAGDGVESVTRSLLPEAVRSVVDASGMMDVKSSHKRKWMVVKIILSLLLKNEKGSWMI